MVCQFFPTVISLFAAGHETALFQGADRYFAQATEWREGKCKLQDDIADSLDRFYAEVVDLGYDSTRNAAIQQFVSEHEVRVRALEAIWESHQLQGQHDLATASTAQYAAHAALVTQVQRACEALHARLVSDLSVLQSGNPMAGPRRTGQVISSTNNGDQLRVEIVFRGLAQTFVNPRPPTLTHLCN